jgi:hypothetical protein
MLLQGLAAIRFAIFVLSLESACDRVSKKGKHDDDIFSKRL